jgi:putative redox protein
MSEKDTHAELTAEDLKGYKQGVAPVTKGTLTWDKDLIFTARTQRGYEIEYDAKIEWGCAPTESLLLSLAGCMGIDMMNLLQKMRVGVEAFKLDIMGERNPSPPQYFKRIEITLNITGKKLNVKKIEKAVSLSQERYCSVYHSLRKDLQVDVKYNLIPTD